MNSKLFSKSLLIIVFSTILNNYVFGQTYDVTVVLKDNSTVRGELLELTPDTVAVLEEETGKYLALKGSEISTVYIKGLNESINFPISEVPDIFEKDKKESKTVPYKPGVPYTPGESYKPTTSRSTQFSIGASIGGLSSMSKEAIEGFSETEFVGETVFSGYFSTVFPGGFALGLCIESFSMELEENGENFGTLNCMPIMLLIQWYKVPYGTGFGAHGSIGFGINNTSFDKGTFITALELIYGVNVNIDTESPFVFELSGGFDYFFSEHISINIEGRFLLGSVGTTWTFGGLVNDDFDNFNITSFQYLAGLRAWFN